MAISKRVLNSSQVVNIEDLRRVARRRLPRSVFDYLDGGAEAELTLAENCRAFRDVTFRPRGAVAVTDCSLKTRVLGHELSLPAMLAPVGYSRLMHPGGEVSAARAATPEGTTPFALPQSLCVHVSPFHRASDAGRSSAIRRNVGGGGSTRLTR